MPPNKKPQSGFTLLEILLVVGVIAILAGIVIVAINPGRQLATVRNTERKTDLKQINSAVQQYYIDENLYPDSISDNLTEVCDTGNLSYPSGVDCTGLVDLSSLVPTYVTAIPKDPQASTTNGTGYKIMKDTGNKIVLSAPQTELNTRITLGNIPPTTVTYNGNTNIAGTVPVDALTYTESATVTVLGNPGSLTKTGYAFTGWNTLANGLGTDYASSSTFVMGTTDVTLYAKWTLWYDSAWTYRKEITINHELVGNGTENETNFPVLISLSGLSHVNVAGTDIRFTLSNHTTLLPREIESYSAGTLYAWVKIPTLSYTADTVIYMYYGNTDATEPTPASTYGSQNVWDGNFSVVYHLTETAGKHLDSTANDYDSEFSDISAPNNGVNVQTQGSATGKIGGADYLSGNFVSWPNGVGVTDVGRSKLTPSILTVSIWAKKEAGESMGWIFSRSCSDYGVSWQGTSYNYYFNGVNGGTLNVTIPESEYNNWHHLVIVFDGSNKKAYLDGTLMATEAQTYWSWYNYYPYKMQFLIGGYRCWDASESLYNGTVDEAHFSNTARSAGWIKTEYNNQNSPSTFYEVTSTDSI